MKRTVFVLVGLFFSIVSVEAGAQSRYNYKTVKSGVYISVAGGYGFFESDDSGHLYQRDFG